MLTIALLLSLAAGGPQAERRDSVVVTGVYEPVELDEADRAVALVEVEPRAALSSSVTGWLQLDSSVDLRQRAPAGVQADLSLRGGAFGQTLVLVDGVRVNDPQTGHHNLDLALPLGSISRIEILKGAGSTFYGSDAVGGAGNLVTRPPRASLVSLGAGVGSFGLNQQQAALSAVRRGVAQRFSFSRDFSRGFRPNRDYRSLALASQTNVSTPLGSAALTLGHADRPFGADRFYGNFGSWERTRTWFASLRQELGAATQATLGYRRHTDLFLLERYRPELYTNRHAAASYQASVRRRDDFGRNTTLHYGAETTADRIGSNNLGRHRRAGGAGYAALEVRALRRYSFSAGLREQYYGGGRWVASPSLAGGAWLTPALKIRASASHAYRLPTFTDLYYRDPATAGSPDLRPERAWSYEAGAGWRAGGGLRADLTLFHRRETDGIDYVRATAADTWRAANIQRLRFTGVEAALAGRAGRSQQWELRHTSLKGARAALGGLLSRYVFNYPSHSTVASWFGTFPAGLAPPGPAGRRAAAGARPLRGAGSVPGVHQWPPAAISATDQPGQRRL
jgi:iron complex outermembrane receptor protein